MLILAEMEGHIDDQTEAYQRRGMSKEEAEKKAVFEMGDPIETGEVLDRIHRPQMSWSMIALIGILSVIGLILQWSIYKMGSNANAAGYLFQDQILYVSIGFAIMLVICLVDYSMICRWIHVLAGCFLVLCVWYAVSGVRVNGTKRYLNLPGGISLAFHVVIYLAIPVFAALLYYHRNGGWRQLAIPVGFMALAIFLFQQSASSPVISMNLVLMAEIILSIVVIKGWYRVRKQLFLPVMWSLSVGFPVVWFLLGMPAGPAYLTERIQYYLGGEPFSYAYGQSSIAGLLENCQWLGDSVGIRSEITDILGIQSDYVLLHAASYYGIFLLLIVVGLLAVLCCKMFRLTLGQKNQLGMILGAGCSLIFLFQIAEYIMMNLGLLLPTTVFLPLFSCGGSGTVVSYILLGLLLSVYRYQNLITESSVKKRRRIVIEMREY